MRAETALLVALTVVLATALPAAALAGEASASGAAAPDASGAAIGDVTAGDAAATSHAATGQDGDDRTVTMDVQLLASGDADWTVSTHVPLETEDDRAAFEDLGRRYVDGTASLDVGLETFQRAVTAASNHSGRSMALVGVERDWTVENGTGVLVLRFTWERFARQADDRLVVDDAFRTETGTWLPRLARGQTLIMRPPEGVGFLETPEGKGVTDGSLRWEGPQAFADDYFRVVYRPEDGVTPTTPSASPTSPTSPTSPSSPPDTPTDTPMGSLPAGIVAVPLLVVGAAAAYLLRRRREDDDEGAGTADDGGPDVPAGAAAADGNDGAVADAAGGADADPGPEAGGGPDADMDAGAGADTAAAADAGGDSGTSAEPTPEEPFAGVDVEMLSDEERVLRLLEANGGRMKQARIVKETDWSNAKVSQLLSSMAEDDAIDKLRIGRENLISLPDVDIDAVEE